MPSNHEAAQRPESTPPFSTCVASIELYEPGKPPACVKVTLYQAHMGVDGEGQDFCRQAIERALANLFPESARVKVTLTHANPEEMAKFAAAIEKRSGKQAEPSLQPMNHANALIHALKIAQREPATTDVLNLAACYLDLLALQGSDDHKDAARDAEHALRHPTSPHGADAVFLNLARCYLEFRRRQKAEPNWKLAALRLWALLDDIDTLDDAAKGDDAAFRKRAYELQRMRFEILGEAHIDAAALDGTLPTTLRRRLRQPCDENGGTRKTGPAAECNCEARARGELGGHRASCPHSSIDTWGVSQYDPKASTFGIGPHRLGPMRGTPTVELIRALVDEVRRNNDDRYLGTDGSVMVYLTEQQARDLAKSNDFQRIVEHCTIERNMTQPEGRYGVICGASLWRAP